MRCIFTESLVFVVTTWFMRIITTSRSALLTASMAECFGDFGYVVFFSTDLFLNPNLRKPLLSIFFNLYDTDTDHLLMLWVIADKWHYSIISSTTMVVGGRDDVVDFRVEVTSDLGVIF